MAWSKNGTPDTLSGTADLCEVTDLTNYNFGVYLINKIASGIARPQTMYNDDTISGSSDYTYRYSNNGGTDATNTSTWGWQTAISSNTVPNFDVCYLCDIDGEEKLGIAFIIEQGTAGAANAPARREEVRKFVASERVSKIHMRNDGGGDYVAGTNISVIGTD